MPIKPLSPCYIPSCPDRAVRWGRCAHHAGIADYFYDKQRGNAWQRGYNKLWLERRKAFLQSHPICTIINCGQSATEVHHTIPKQEGGTDDDENLLALCQGHHAQVTARKTVKEKG